MSERRKIFTVGFEGDISALKGNPFHVKSEFGSAVIMSRADVFAERDALEEQRGDLLTVLRKIIRDWDGEPEDIAEAVAAVARAERC